MNLVKIKNELNCIQFKLKKITSEIEDIEDNCCNGGGGFDGIVTEDSDTVTFSGDGTEDSPLSAESTGGVTQTLQQMVVDNNATWTAGNQQISFTPNQTSIYYDDDFGGAGTVGIEINNNQFSLYATADLPVYIEGTGFVKYAGHYSPIAESIDGFTLMPKDYIIGSTQIIPSYDTLTIPNSKNIFIYPESAIMSETWILPEGIDVGQEIFISNRSEVVLVLEGTIYEPSASGIVPFINIPSKSSQHLIYTGTDWLVIK